MRVYMQTQPDAENMPRFYQLALQEDLIDGWTLVREWGRTGSPGRVKKDHFDNHESALNALLKVRDAQMNRGFRVVYMRGDEHT